MPAQFVLFVPPQAVGASLVYFDFFNAGAGRQQVRFLSLVPTVSGATAVVGTVAVDLYLTRTTTVGTGGTTATFGDSSLTACSINVWNHSTTLTSASGISARLTPTGGATAGSVLGWTSVFTEETADGTYTYKRDLLSAPLLVHPGSGIRVVQGSVASVGNIGFNCLFEVDT